MEEQKAPLTDFSQWTEQSPESFANLVICLIHQATCLLGWQINRLERDFQKEGGFTERLNRARVRARQRRSALGWRT